MAGRVVGWIALAYAAAALGILVWAISGFFRRGGEMEAWLIQFPMVLYAAGLAWTVARADLSAPDSFVLRPLGLGAAALHALLGCVAAWGLVVSEFLPGPGSDLGAFAAVAALVGVLFGFVPGLFLLFTTSRALPYFLVGCAGTAWLGVVIC